MLIAHKKLKENIAEYILYMWRVEDVVRALKFDINQIKNAVILNQTKDKSIIDEITKWYEDIINNMKIQGIEEKGHLNETQEKIQELNFLHFTLLQSLKDKDYMTHHESIQETLGQFKEKSKMQTSSDVEICLHALNMKLLLKLQKKEISLETEEAFKGFAKLLALLSAKYKSQFEIAN